MKWKPTKKQKNKTKNKGKWLKSDKTTRYVSLDDNDDDDKCRMSMMIIHSNLSDDDGYDIDDDNYLFLFKKMMFTIKQDKTRIK